MNTNVRNIVVFALLQPFIVFADANPHGQFKGPVIVEWLQHEGPDRNVKLLKDFVYEDPTGREWIAPKDWVIDGASIPWILWNKWIGPPFVGDYRRASVVHDIACDQREDAAPSSQTVHRMFFDACLAGGVGETKARIMYWAVRNLGFTCRWGDQDAKNVLSPDQYQELIEIDREIKAVGITEGMSARDITRAINEFKVEQQR